MNTCAIGASADMQTPNMNEDAWLQNEEGQLSVDVIETPESVIVRSAIAGISPNDLDIAVTGDAITIRGMRAPVCESSQDETIHIQECFWGAFSRSVVLPCRVKADETDAVMKNGVLTVTLPKAETNARVRVIEEPGT